MKLLYKLSIDKKFFSKQSILVIRSLYCNIESKESDKYVIRKGFCPNIYSTILVSHSEGGIGIDIIDIEELVAGLNALYLSIYEFK